MSDSSKHALLVVLNNVISDPRVRRQIDWLTDAGWTVDTLGLGEHPTPQVRDHFKIESAPQWARSTGGLAVIHGLMPVRARFKTLYQNQFPGLAGQRVAAGSYDLVLFNDIQLLPWLDEPSAFGRVPSTTKIHLDIHEWFDPDVPHNTRGRALIRPYYRYTRNLIASPKITSRSLAADAVDLYTNEFHIPAPPVVRNAPPFVDQKPSAVDPGNIRLLHHGVAAWERGLRELIEAMGKVDDGFTLTFMLVGDPGMIDKLTELAAPLGSKIQFVPPAPMTTLSQSINEYDAEVMFYPPKSVNLEIAFPNKFFEAIQGRLAMVIGPTKSMAEIVSREGNGVIAKGWEVADLVEAISSMTAENVTEMKKRSDAIAPDLCAEGERGRFFESIGFPEK